MFLVRTEQNQEWEIRITSTGENPTLGTNQKVVPQHYPVLFAYLYYISRAQPDIECLRAKVMYLINKHLKIKSETL
jgi:hypothetical protein